MKLFDKYLVFFIKSPPIILFFVGTFYGVYLLANLDKDTTSISNIAFGIVAVMAGLSLRMASTISDDEKLKDDFLYFYPKKETQQTQFAHFIHVLYAHSYNFRHFIDSLDKKINIYYQWEKDIKIKISDDPEKILNIYDKKAGELLQQVTYSLKNLINQWASEKYERVVNCCYYWYEKIVRFKFRKVLKANIIKNLCCLKCGSQSISNKDKLLVCQKCKQTYILENGIPIMLNKHDLSKGY